MLSKKQASKFILKTLLFLTILFFLDYVIGGILCSLYFKQDSGYLYRTTYAMDSTKADVVIFGSSTANHHYDPQAFENRLHLTVYNTGRDGNTLFYSYAVLQTILKRYTPKIAILNFDIGEFQKEEDSYDRLSSLLPYFNKHPDIRPIIELRGPYEKYKLLSKIYPFNSLIFSIGIGNTDYNRNRENVDDEQGYIPLNNVWKKPIYNDTSKVKYRLDTNKINSLKDFIEDCVNSHIQLFIFVSPRYIKYASNDQSIEITHSIANHFGIPFYDYSKDSFFWSHPELFDDQTHMNDSGAKVFSNKVIDDIISVDQEKNIIRN